MALHGEIKINYRTLLWWCATRLRRLEDPDAVHTYRVECLWKDPVTGSVEDRVETVLEHRYSDGAAKLAIAVIEWADAQRGEWTA